MTRKFSKVFVALLVALTLTFAMTGCDDNDGTKTDPAAKYTVTYAAGEGATGTAPTGGQYAEGATFTLPEATGLRKDGSTFAAWNDGTNNYAAGATYTMPAKDVTFIATWKVSEPSGGEEENADVTISFDANGGSGAMTAVTKKVGDVLDFTADAFVCGFTAPADSVFLGWATTATGDLLADGTVLSSSMAADGALTLYAVWDEQSSDVALEDLTGVWTGEGTLEVIAYTNATTGATACGVLNGNLLVNFIPAEGVYYIMTPDYETLYGFMSKGSRSLVINIPEMDDNNESTGEVEQIVFTEHGTLTNAPISDFAGKWTRASNNQPWIIEASGNAYYSLTARTATATTIGSHLVLTYSTLGSDYTYLLHKEGDALEGYYLAPEAVPVEVAFAAGTFYSVKVKGVYNQIVMSGTPNAIKPPAAPSGQQFSKWVLVGTDTEFRFDDVLTADVDIEATYENIPTPPAGAVKTYTGTYGPFNRAITVTINTTTKEVTFIQGSSTYGPHSVSDYDDYWFVESSNNPFGEYVWITFNEDTLTIYDDYNDEPYEVKATLTFAE